MKFIKRILLISLFCLSLLVFPLASQALKVEYVPNPRVESGGWVTDMAGILSVDTETQLNGMIRDLEAKNGTEIAVVTIFQTNAETTTRQFANELFNHWEIGKAEADNGILFLISKNDRKVRIETGYGIEAVLPDAKIGEILDTEILPYFKEKDFDTGTLNGTKALIKEVQNQDFSITPPPQISLFPRLTNISLWQQPLITVFRLIMTAGIAIALTAIAYSWRHKFAPIPDSNEKTSKISVWYALVEDRAIALVIDFAFLSFIHILALFTIGSLPTANLKLLPLLFYFPINPEAMFDLAFLIGWTGFGGALLIYRVVTESYFGCTLGKLCLDLRVLKPDDSPMGLDVSRIRQLHKTDEPPVGAKLAFLRNFFLILDGFLFYLVGAIAMSKSKTSQRIGDRIAGTIVVRRGTRRTYYSPAIWGKNSSRSSFPIDDYIGDTRGGGSFGGGSSDGGGADGDF